MGQTWNFPNKFLEARCVSVCMVRLRFVKLLKAREWIQSPTTMPSGPGTPGSPFIPGGP